MQIKPWNLANLKEVLYDDYHTAPKSQILFSARIIF